MASGPPTAARRPFWRRRLVWLAVLAAILGGVLFVARDRLVWTPLARTGAAWLARETGFELRFDRLAAEGVRSVELTGVELRDLTDGPPRARASVERLVVELRPLALLRGDLRGLLGARAVGGSIALDVAAFETDAEGDGGALAPDAIPPLALVDVDLAVDLASGRRVAVDELDLAVTATGAGRRVALAAEALRVLDGSVPRWSLDRPRVGAEWTLDTIAVDALAVEGVEHALDLRIALDGAGRPTAASLHLPLSGGELLARAPLADPAATVVDFELETSALAAALAEVLALASALADRDLALPADAAALDGAVSVDGRFDVAALSADGTLDATGLRHAARPDLAVDLTSRVTASAARVRVEALDARLSGGGATLRSGAFELELGRAGPVALAAAAGGSASVTVAPDSALWTLLPPLDGPRPAVALTLSTPSGSPAARIDSFDAELPGARFELDTGEVELVLVDEAPTWRYALDGHLAVDAPEALADAFGLARGAPLRGRAAARLSVAGLGSDFDALLDGGAEAFALAPWLPDAPALERVDLSLRAGPAEGGELALDLVELEIEAGEDLLSLSGAVRLDPAEPSAARLVSVDGWARVGDLRRFAPALPALAVESSISGAGPLLDPSLRAGVGWSDARRPTALSGDAIVAWTDGALVVEQAGVALGAARLVGTGRVAPAPDGAVDVRVTTLRIASDASELALTEPVALRIEADGTFVLPTVEFAGSVGTLTLARRDDGSWRTQLVGVPAGDLAAPWLPPGVDLGVLDGQLDFVTGPDGQSLRGQLALDAPAWGGDLVGRGGEAEAVALRASSAVLAVDVASAPGRAAAGTLSVDLDALSSAGVWPGATAPAAAGGGRLAVRLEPTGSADVELELDLDQRFRLALAGELRFPAPLAGVPTLDELSSASLALDGQGVLSSLGALSGRIEALRAAEGRLELDRIEVGGTVGAPELALDARLVDGFIRFGGDIPPIRSLNGPITLRGDRLELEGLSGEAGAAPLRVAGGIELGGDTELDLALTGENVLILRRPDLTLRADLDVTLTGPLAAALLEGSAVLRNSRYTRAVDFLGLREGSTRPRATRRGIELFQLREPPFSNLRFDVAVTAAPGEPFAVQTNLVRGAMRPDLRLVGNGEMPELRGSIFLDPTRVTLPSTRLRTSSGTITFDAANPFMPRVDLRAETRMRGYDVSVVVSGPYDQPEILVTTVPPLPERDALLLLVTGQLPESALTGSGGVQAAQMLAVFLAQDIGSQFFGASTEGEDSMLDRFETFVGRDVSKGGLETVEIQFRLLEDWLVDGDRLYLTAERDEYEDVNGGIRLLFRFD